MGPSNRLKNILTNQYLVFSFRILLGIIFIWASWDKIREPAKFAQIIYNYKLLPLSLINLWAIILPWLELVCGICLIVGCFTQSAAGILAVLLFIFIVAIGINVYRDLDITCGCFSTSGGRKIGLLLLAQDLLLLVISLVILKAKKTPLALEEFISSRMQKVQPNNVKSFSRK